MADNKKIIPIDQLPEAPFLNDSDAVLVVNNGSVTMRSTIGEVGTHLLTEQTFSGLNTTNKQIVKAINEVKGVELYGTLKAGKLILHLQMQQLSSIVRYTPILMCME